MRKFLIAIIIAVVLGTAPLVFTQSKTGRVGTGYDGSAHNISVPLACEAASASGTAYTCSTSPTFTPADGDEVLFEADVANTGSATLAVNGAAAATIKKTGGGTNLVANDLLANQWTIVLFDGTNWQMLGELGQLSAPPFPLLAPNGSNAAPSYSFTNSTNSGFFWDNVNSFLVQAILGVNQIAFFTGQMRLKSTYIIAFNTGDPDVNTNDAGLSRCATGTVCVGNGVGNNSSGTIQPAKYATDTNCAANGTAANPSVAACGSAAAGMFSCATNASTTTCQINTTAVTANSEITVTQDAADGGAGQLNVTCNTALVTPAAKPILLSKSAGVSFTLNMGVITANPGCFEYTIKN